MKRRRGRAATTIPPLSGGRAPSASVQAVAGRLLRWFGVWLAAAFVVLWMMNGLVWHSLERAILIAAACTVAMAFAGL